MAEESYPQDLKYFKEHDWVRVDGDEATFGVTWYAQNALGEVVYATLPEVGTTVTAGQVYGELESVKTPTDINAPLSGEVIAVNEELQTDWELVNTEPYGGGWLTRVRMSDPAELEDLMSADEYREFLATAGS